MQIFLKRKEKKENQGSITSHILHSSEVVSLSLGFFTLSVFPLSLMLSSLVINAAVIFLFPFLSFCLDSSRVGNLQVVWVRNSEGERPIFRHMLSVWTHCVSSSNESTLAV